MPRDPQPPAVDLSKLFAEMKTKALLVRQRLDAARKRRDGFESEGKAR